jgi:hypothetical protein
MRGGAQSHLMRCSDGNYYVVKFQNNPQHRRVLVNEMLSTRMASRLGLPTAPVAVVQVQEELIRLPELCIELPRSRTPCQPGLQFASRYPGDPRQLAKGASPGAAGPSGSGPIYETPSHQTPVYQTPRYETVMIDQGFCFNGGEWTFPERVHGGSRCALAGGK